MSGIKAKHQNEELPLIIPQEIEIKQTEEKRSDDVFGFRMTSSSSGSNTISLINKDAIDIFIEQMSEINEFETDLKNSFYTANIGDEVFKLYDLE